ncbi:MAG: hypothetical protein Q9168_005589 [Polycauliona sp. 1 TL-2023]
MEELLAKQTSQIIEHFDQKFDSRESEREIHQARDRFLSSLFFPEMKAREDEVDDAYKGTCMWIFDPPTIEGSNTWKWHSFREWLESGTGVYWISGKPGAGKSTLIKYIIGEPRTAQYLDKWEPNTHLITPIFFFKNLGTELQKSAIGLLRSLIMQITELWPDMISLILRRYGHATGQSQEPHLLTRLPTWTEKQLRLILEDFISEKPATVTLCVFIDGLDEYTGDEEILLEIISLLNSVAGCKVCVSSRPEQVFHTEFKHNPQCRVQDLNEKDIGKMVIEKLKPSLEKDKPTETEAIRRLIRDLIRKAEGVFLWLSIMMKDLIKASRNCDSMSELRRRLEVTPGTMHGLYQRILEGLDAFHKPYAFKIFQTIIAANYCGRRVTILGLACAEETSWEHVKELHRSYFSSASFDLTCSELLTRLNSRCGNLIEVQASRGGLSQATTMRYSRDVDFVHRTATEFLKKEYEGIFSTRVCLASAGAQIARTSIGLLCLFTLRGPHSDEYQLLADSGKSIIETHSHGDEIIRDIQQEKEQLQDYLFSTMRCGMRAISYKTCDLSDEDSLHFDNEETELAAYMWQTLQWLARSRLLPKHTTSYGHFSIESILQPLDGSAMDHIQATQNIFFGRPMVFAAYWGCNSYLRTHLSARTPKEEIEDAFESVLMSRYVKDSNFETSMCNLNTMDMLLQEWQIPRMKTGTHGRLFKRLWRASPWGAFALQDFMIGKHHGWSDVEETAWLQRLLEVFKKFLSLGADCNTRLSFRICFRKSLGGIPPQHEIFVDKSPLAHLCARTQTLHDKSVLKVSELLRSEGAVERRRYRYCLCDKIYYRINTSQSNRLDTVLHRFGSQCQLMQDFRGHIVYREMNGSNVFDALDPILEDIRRCNDTLDWDTLDKEWERGYSDWLEEYHEGDIDTEQESRVTEIEG